MRDGGGVINSNLSDIIDTFILEGYKYKDICKTENGDYVIDGGAYTGNTAIYFSKNVKDLGKVYAFEAMPVTYNLLCENVKTYKNIIPVNMALTEKTTNLNFSSNPTFGAHVTDDAMSSIIVHGTSIDEFVKNNNIEKIDFIKMDIEGSELSALNGCRDTISKFAPKLAICIYHKPEDWISIPKKIRELNPKYKLYLKHNSKWFHETVLFAIEDKNKRDDIQIKSEEVRLVKNMWQQFDEMYNNKELLVRNEIKLKKLLAESSRKRTGLRSRVKGLTRRLWRQLFA